MPTTDSKEAKEALSQYADILDMYAGDQEALMARYSGQKTERKWRAKIYRELAQEMREVVYKP